MGALLEILVKYLLPYPDPMRRRRMRRAARALISCSPWPEDQARPADVAQLALLRLLRLQREAHRVAAFQNFESTTLLARAAVETCIAGLYWLYSDDAAGRLSGANAKAVRRMLEFMADNDPVTPAALDELVLMIGVPSAPPSLRDMAQAVTRKTSVPFATELYVRLYIPLSTLFAHPTGVAMLRHVGADRQLRDRPDRCWSKRAALHGTDVCTAQLALAIAEQAGMSSAPFLEYAKAHMERTAHPIMTMTSRRALRSIRLSRVPRAYRSLMTLRRSRMSGEYALDTSEQRKSFAKRALDEILQVLDADVGEQMRDQIIDKFAELLADSSTPEPGS